ncbi:MAG: class I SAM-dependent methyltransferase [Acidobacteriia bacterium]|nr:class I SAM-dependent methyltransferase [Terriglobia bacterium]
MEPNAFVAEVYRRMSLRHRAERRDLTFADVSNDNRVLQAVFEYAPMLPLQKDAAILDIGFGGGWFIAACLKLGYTNISGADFGIGNKAHIRAWHPDFITLHEIEQDIGSFLASRPEQYAFVHMSHVIEHIPKYSLFWVVDALYRALRQGGTLCLRTPNMEGPTPNSSFYVTLTHEYGFCGSNLRSLLDICGFDDIHFHPVRTWNPTVKQRIGAVVRLPFLLANRVRHRLFGVNSGEQFDTELVVTAKRNSWPPFFDPKYR